MKVRTRIFLILAACLSVGAPRAFAQEAGRLRLSGLEKLTAKASEAVDVNLDGSMLRLAAKFMDDDDADSARVKHMLRNMKGIYVKDFEFDKEGEYSPADVEAIRAQLRSPVWSRIVTVRSKEHENAEVYVMGKDQESRVEGLAIIVADPKELTVVNLVGPINLDDLSSLGGHMGIPKVRLPQRAKKPAPGKGHEAN